MRSCLQILSEANLITVADPQAHTRSLVCSPDKIRVGDVVRAFHSKSHLKRAENGDSAEEAFAEMAFIRTIKHASLNLDTATSVSEWTLADIIRAA